MTRPLTHSEKNKINEICKLEMSIAIKYGNFAKVIAPIFTILVFLFLYFEISWGSIWIYLSIGFFISISEIIGITVIQTPYVAIRENNCLCIDTKMISSRKVLRTDPQNLLPQSFLEKTVRPGEVRYYNYYVSVTIDGEIKEIEYRGKEFEQLSNGEAMLIISFKNRKKETKYICFSNKEINS